MKLKIVKNIFIFYFIIGLYVLFILLLNYNTENYADFHNNKLYTWLIYKCNPKTLMCVNISI